MSIAAAASRSTLRALPHSLHDSHRTGGITRVSAQPRSATPVAAAAAEAKKTEEGAQGSGSTAHDTRVDAE